MEFIGFAVFGGVFLVLAFVVFTGLIWAAFSDGRDNDSSSALRGHRIGWGARAGVRRFTLGRDTVQP